MARQLYDYWFVQFDFPDENGKPYKLSGGEMVWNEEIKREIPKDWTISPLKDYIGKNNTGDWGYEDNQPSRIEVGCIRGADIAKLNDLPRRFIKKSNESKLLTSWDIVIEVSGGSPSQATGRCAFITPGVIGRNGDNITCSNFCHAFSMKHIETSAFFFYVWKMFYDNNAMFNFEGKTSGIKNFMTDTFLSVKWVFPPFDLMEKFFLKVKTIYEEVDTNIEQINKLIRQRDELLPLLMNGQVSVMQKEVN